MFHLVLYAYLLHSGTKAEMQQLEMRYVSGDDNPASFISICESSENIAPTKRKSPEGICCIKKIIQQYLMH